MMKGYQVDTLTVVQVEMLLEPERFSGGGQKCLDLKYYFFLGNLLFK